MVRGNTESTLLGKRAKVPPDAVVGRNCIVNSACDERSFLSPELADGETLYANGEVA